MSIDRQGIVDNILGGFGRPAGPAEMNGVTFDKYFLDKWSVPYDPDMARQYLADAGWPDGFEMEVRCTTGHPLMVEMCEAIAKGMTDIGLDVNIVTLAYSANRPCVVARECGNWWFRTGGEGLGLNPEIALLRRNTVRTFNPGFEIREQLEILAQIDACKSSECLDELRDVHWDWWHHNQQIIGVVETYGLFGVNIEKVGEWKIPFGMGGLAAFDRIQKP
jgi:ABC-type transport system substrate-binding protein